MPTSTDPYADVVVVGAGQAGLSVAAHLSRAGFVPASVTGTAPTDRPTYAVLDAAPGPGGAWRERWPGLTMRTVNGVYELPGRSLPAFDADEPASDALTRYFGDYERDLGLPVRRAVQVRAVRDLGGADRLLAVETVERPAQAGPAASPGHLGPRGTHARPDPDDVLGCGAGAARPVPDPVPHVRDAAPAAAPAPARRTRRTWRTRALVNATGTWTRPFWPTYPGSADFAGTQLHTHDYRTPEDLAGRHVLVVGGGISAVQHLLAVHPVAASTTWVTRRPPDWRDEEFSPSSDVRPSPGSTSARAPGDRRAAWCRRPACR